MTRVLRNMCGLTPPAIVLLVAFTATGQAHADSAATPLPRTVIAVWDSTIEHRWRATLLHQMAEMPLNHLGLVLEPHDVNAPLPDLSRRPDVRGVLTWFQTDSLAAPAAYLEWAARGVAAGKRYVVIGELGFLADRAGTRTPDTVTERLLAPLGLGRDGTWQAYPYALRPLLADALIGFERPLGTALPPFDVVRAIDPAAVSHLAVGLPGKPVVADLVVTGPHGGYLASQYSHYADDMPHRQWIVDPFEFFRLAFATDDLPKPDVTTLVGRRIFYSQIDGDGWRNTPEYDAVPSKSGATERRPRSIEVLIDEIIRPHPELPVSVAPIAADLDPAWCGDELAQRAARTVFALPQVEAGSHTYSHPLDWEFFAAADPAKERRFDAYYARCHDSIGRAALAWTRRALDGRDAPIAGADRAPDGLHHPTPRSYAEQPFSIELEISGAPRYIKQFLPAGKQVALVQWSGDTVVFADAIRRVHRAGLVALNGGDTRLDPDFSSVAWVAPVGRWVDGEWQIYSSASNENTYTGDWTRNYFAFKYLPRTLEATDRPRRLKPIDVYYHVFSGDRLASLAALKSVLAWVGDREIAPIRTSEYVRIAEGFYSVQLVALAEGMWRVEDRGALQTLRFDRVEQRCLDLARSQGVLGARLEAGSLYVALDPDSARPIVALGCPARPASGIALRHSRWPIHGLVRDADARGFHFEAHGFGRGEMVWEVPATCPQWTWRLTRVGVSRSTTGTVQATAGALALDLGLLVGEEARVALACTEWRT